jgi:hypothetical protein
VLPRHSLTSRALIVGASALLACSGGGTTGTTGTTGTGGAGGEGGACPMGPQAMFTITITAAGGIVPADTHVLVSWSAGTEPEFELDDKKSWKTLDDANLVCNVDPHGPPPTNLAELVCQVWSNGATKVVVSAQGFTTFEKTYVPPLSEHCHGLLPTLIDVKLERAEDAGAN